MTYFQAIVLALVQAVTEFLPISSSGHLILVPWALGWPDQGLAFDVATNTGTLLAVLVYFRRDLLQMLRFDPRVLWGGAPWTPAARLAVSVVVGTIPVAVAGLLAYDWIATTARNPGLIGVEMILFGLLLALADRNGRRERGTEQMGVADTVLIGSAQALALLPGTSRSGITMTAGLARGLTREAAARYAFLLAVPVGLLAGAHDALKLYRGAEGSAPLGPTLVALAVSAVAGYAVIDFLLGWVRRQSLLPFVIYRLVVGAVVLAVWWLG